MKNQLSTKDAQKRELILTGNLWYVLLFIGTPLALYQGANSLFKIYDSFVAAYISPLSVSAVAYLAQISMMISAIGTGLAVGASIKIGEAYGAGDYEVVTKRINALFLSCGFVAMFLVAFMPFSAVFLRLIGTPEEFVQEGTTYFTIAIVDNILILFNLAYLAIERARGNSSRILKFNMIAVVLKLACSSFFVFVMHSGITMIAFATVLSNLVIFIAFLYNLCWKPTDNIFALGRIKPKTFVSQIKAILKTSFPVIVERITFQLGKVAVNGMAAIYGAVVVGALGISNNVSSATVGLQGGFQEAGITIISQNLGASNQRRALEAFYKLLCINILIGLVGTVVMVSFLDQIISLFAGDDVAFASTIKAIVIYECVAFIPMGALTSALALLYGCGFTKLTLLVNFCRVFVLRVPVLWFLQNFTQIGSESVGIVMMVSNVGTGVLALVLGVFVVAHVKRQIVN